MNKTIRLIVASMSVGALMGSECNASAWVQSFFRILNCKKDKNNSADSCLSKSQEAKYIPYTLQYINPSECPNEAIVREVIPEDYELQNVPSDELCCYWAVSAAQIILNNPSAKDRIYVFKKYIDNIFAKVEHYIDCIKDGRRPVSVGILEDCKLLSEEIDFAVESVEGCNGDLCKFKKELKECKIQANDGVFKLIARALGVNICVKSIIMDTRKNEDTHEKILTYSACSHLFEGSNSSDAPLIQLFYEGNGSFGHYKVIAPKNEMRTLCFWGEFGKILSRYRGEEFVDFSDRVEIEISKEFLRKSVEELKKKVTIEKKGGLEASESHDCQLDQETMSSKKDAPVEKILEKEVPNVEESDQEYSDAACEDMCCRSETSVAPRPCFKSFGIKDPGWENFEKSSVSGKIENKQFETANESNSCCCTAPVVPSGCLDDFVFFDTQEPENGASEENFASMSAKHVDWLPEGCELQNVPGDGLCGYWAVLTALKILEDPNKEVIDVTDSEVSDLANKFAEYIENIHSNEQENEEAFLQLATLMPEYGMGQNVAENDAIVESFLQSLRGLHIQMDYTFYRMIMKIFEIDLEVKSYTKRKDEYGCYNMFSSKEESDERNKKDETTQDDKTKDNKKGMIQLYYEGNGRFGHYQVIAPKLKNGKKRIVHFEESKEKSAKEKKTVNFGELKEEETAKEEKVTREEKIVDFGEY